jgi:hypothetical protein
MKKKKKKKKTKRKKERKTCRQRSNAYAYNMRISWFDDAWRSKTEQTAER